MLERRLVQQQKCVVINERRADVVFQPLVKCVAAAVISAGVLKIKIFIVAIKEIWVITKAGLASSR